MKSPFKFLDAYTLEDKDYFFGRDQEIENLYKLVFKTPIMLVYGPSGTGKTSLVQCGLAGRFDGPDWYPFFIRKHDDINQSLFKALKGALNGQTPEEPAKAVKDLFRQYLRPVYLIFDQFEELFILGREEEKQQFINTIHALLKADLPCRILLVMREEYIGKLYEFEKVVPSLFDYRLRVEPMNTARVKSVIAASFDKFNIDLEPPAEDRLEQMIENISAGKSVIQLPYLQVYLDMLYREDYHRVFGEQKPPEELPHLQFSREEIDSFGNIEEVLDKFLREQVVELQRSLQEKYADLPPDTIRKTLDIFVTEEGTKRPIRFERGEDNQPMLIDKKAGELLPPMPPGALSFCLEQLEQRRLLRFSDEIIEPAHDSLAALIDQQRTDEQRLINEINRLVKNNFLEYQRTGEHLSRRQLNAYEPYLDKINLDPGHQQFLEESRKHIEQKEQEERAKLQRAVDLALQNLEAEQRARRRQRNLLIAVAVFAIVAVVLGLLIFNERQKVNKKNEDLISERFEREMNDAISQKNDGRYYDALSILSIADTFATTPERKYHLDSLRNIVSRLAVLIPTADSIVSRVERGMPSQKEQDLLIALENYDSALIISNDLLIISKRDKAEKEIQDRFNSHMARVKGLEAYPEHALPELDSAQSLLPKDPETVRRIFNMPGTEQAETLLDSLDRWEQRLRSTNH
jgi:hypothetical protein